jgi:orotidine-5'-phosphate decarboxylase
MGPQAKLIVALDVPTAAAAHKIVAAIGDSANIYKVGLQLYSAEGPQIIRDLIASGRQVFLELKLHDIPNTVGAAVHEAAGLGIAMLTVHALGGQRMLRAAIEAACAVDPSVRVVAVTVLTSMDESELGQVGVQGGILPEVMRLASLAAAAGCHGVVSSAREASQIRSHFGEDFLIVTPGVRPEGAAHGDQARVVTPAQAIAAGASHIVVGRPIIEAADPAQAAREILSQMESALSVNS